MMFIQVHMQEHKGYFADFGVVEISFVVTCLEDWLVVMLSYWTPGFYCWDG